MTWTSKFDYIKARSFEDVLSLWSRRSPVGIELGQNRLTDHIEYVARDIGLPDDGTRYLGPIESRTLISELYFGVTKAFNLNFHAQKLAKGNSFTNGSLHSFNSIMQFMLAIMSIFGIFIVRKDGKYFIIDVFPWLGHLKEDRRLGKQYGEQWWRYGRIIADRKETIDQGDVFRLFQRCLRITSATGWREFIVAQLIDCEERWFNRPRNNILYNFTGWTNVADLTGETESDVSGLLRAAVRSIFDYEAQTAYGSLPQSLLLGSLLTHVWRGFRAAVSMELDGQLAPEFPRVGDASLIAEFEKALDELVRTRD